MQEATKAKYWSSSPLVNGKRVHSILMSVKGPEVDKTILIASAINGVVSKRIAELLDKGENS